jgi:hypothetical protein
MFGGGTSAKGEKNRDVYVDFKDILISIRYLVRPLATMVRGKPRPKQGQILAVKGERNVARMSRSAMVGLDKWSLPR